MVCTPSVVEGLVSFRLLEYSKTCVNYEVVPGPLLKEFLTYIAKELYPDNPQSVSFSLNYDEVEAEICICVKDKNSFNHLTTIGITNGKFSDILLKDGNITKREVWKRVLDFFKVVLSED